MLFRQDKEPCKESIENDCQILLEITSSAQVTTGSLKTTNDSSREKIGSNEKVSEVECYFKNKDKKKEEYRGALD